MPEAELVTITEFLLARIAEDEEAARAEVQRLRDWQRDFAGRASIAVTDWDTGPGDPARVLADCKAKRRIVADLDWAERDYRTTRAESDEVRRLAALLAAARIVAVYADHPDYREEWRP